MMSKKNALIVGMSLIEDELTKLAIDYRHIINQASPSNRRLKKILRKKSRKALDKYLRMWYN